MSTYKLTCPNPKCPVVEISDGALLCPKCGARLIKQMPRRGQVVTK